MNLLKKFWVPELCLVAVLFSVAWLLLSGCSRVDYYRRHVLPGPNQAFEGPDSVVVFLQFDQVFTPLDKRGGWDHPTGRKAGGYQWFAELSKKGGTSRVFQIEETLALSPDGRMSFNRNLSRIFSVDGSWYAGVDNDRKLVVVAFDEGTRTFKLSDKRTGDPFKRLSETDRLSEHHGIITLYNETASFRPIGDYGDLPWDGEEKVRPAKIQIKESKNAFEVTLSIAGQQDTSVSFTVENQSQIVTSEDIDAIPLE